MNILFVCTAHIGSQMASPGIRSYFMAQAMQKLLPHDNITLGYAGDTDFDPLHQNFRMERIDGGRLRSVAGTPAPSPTLSPTACCACFFSNPLVRR